MKHEPIPVEMITPGFPHYDTKYMCTKCCCGTVHATKAAKRVGVAMAIMLGITILLYLFKMFGWSKDLRFELGTTTILLFEIACLPLLFVGIKRLNPCLVCPVVFIWFLNVAYFALVFIACIYAMIFPYSQVAGILKEHAPQDWYQKNRNNLTGLRVGFSFAALLVLPFLALNYWFFDVIKRCYNYLRDFSKHRKRYNQPKVVLGKEAHGKLLASP